MGISTNVNVDKLTLLWRYPTEVMHSILAKGREVIQNGGGLGYRIPANRAGAQARLLLMLLDGDAQPTGYFADLRFYLALSAKGTPHSYVRVEWNPAKAGSLATAFLLDDLKAFLPDSDLMDNAYVTRIDLAVDVPGIRCAHLAAQRISNHKKAEVYVNARGRSGHDPDRCPRVVRQNRHLPAGIRQATARFR
jgi:hypothetical protein